jgi:hypothetical protein
LKPIEEQGYICLAVNTDHIDYVSMARRLFSSLRRFHPRARTCLLTDKPVEHPEFDHVRLLNANSNAYANDSQAFGLTPFRETIKLEADMLITSEIDHWWAMLRHRDLVISTGCRDWKGRRSLVRDYRRCFDENDLPDVYNAVTYWRLSQTARDFFSMVRQIFDHWVEVKKLLKFAENRPSTDLVYAVAAKILGPESVTLPFASYPQIIHMKPSVAGTAGSWDRNLVWEYHDGNLRVDTLAQWGAFHYHNKNWQP